MHYFSNFRALCFDSAHHLFMFLLIEHVKHVHEIRKISSRCLYKSIEVGTKVTNLYPHSTLQFGGKFKHFRDIITIQKNFLIWISCSFKEGASINNISYFDQSFQFSGLWLILARDLGRSGQYKSWGTQIEEIILFFFKFWTV